jgi:hypothetical protein
MEERRNPCPIPLKEFMRSELLDFVYKLLLWALATLGFTAIVFPWEILK